jgi:PilZ domain
MDSSDTERRTKARIQECFPVTVRVNRKSEAFKTDTVIENLSSSGLYMKLPFDVEQGTKLFALLLLSPVGSGESASRVALRGVVTRSDPQPEGTYGVAVVIKQHRFV